MGGIKPHYDCIKAFSETDFTEDLKKFDVPTLILHGDDDQIVPIAAAGLMSAKIVKNATLKVYPGFPHGCQQPTRTRSMPTARLCPTGKKQQLRGRREPGLSQLSREAGQKYRHRPPLRGRLSIWPRAGSGVGMKLPPSLVSQSRSRSVGRDQACQ